MSISRMSRAATKAKRKPARTKPARTKPARTKSARAKSAHAKSAPARLAAKPSRRKPADKRTNGISNEERYALALESINESVYDWNVETDEVYFSSSLRVMLGLKPEQPITREGWAGLIHPDDRDPHRQTLLAHFRGDTARFESEFRYRAIR
jgi:PAS domain-containing protein